VIGFFANHVEAPLAPCRVRSVLPLLIVAFLLCSPGARMVRISTNQTGSGAFVHRHAFVLAHFSAYLFFIIIAILVVARWLIHCLVFLPVNIHTSSHLSTTLGCAVHVMARSCVHCSGGCALSTGSWGSLRRPHPTNRCGAVVIRIVCCFFCRRRERRSSSRIEGVCVFPLCYVSVCRRHA
jgi:hypothetical protein